MTILYLDTAAALKLLVKEHESTVLRTEMQQWLRDGVDVVASWLLYTELHCAALRRHARDTRLLDAVLDVVALIDVERSHLMTAASTPHGLRSADAIHLATALDVEAEALVTYDRELQLAAAAEGLRVLHPAPSQHPTDGSVDSPG